MLVTTRLRLHHHIRLPQHAQESSWREDNRRVSNGDQVNRVAGLAWKRGKSASRAAGSARLSQPQEHIYGGPV
jgi:hypothetical protein